MKARKNILTVFLSVIFALLLAACELPTAASSSLPTYPGNTQDMTKEEAIAKFEELTGEDLSDGEFKNCIGFKADADRNDYLDYVKLCERIFTNEGQKSDGDVHATLFSDSKNPDVIVLVCYEGGKIYVAQFEAEFTSAPQEAFAEWPSAEAFAYFHVNLTEPQGVKIRHALFSSKENDSLVPYTALNITIQEGNYSVYSSLKGEIVDAGYTLGQKSGLPSADNNGTYTYSAAMVKNGVEYTAHIDFAPHQENTVNVYFENTTMRFEADQGKNPAYIFNEATVGIKETGISYRTDESGKDVLTSIEEYTYFSFNERYFLEWYGDRLGYPNAPKEPTGSDFDTVVINGIEDYIRLHGGWLYEMGTDNLYNIVGDYKNKVIENVSDHYTTKTYSSGRGLSAISRFYATAQNLEKTGNTMVIAGIECAEYVGITGIIDGEFISWSATFYVWEAYDMPMMYLGKQYYNGEQLDYAVEICHFDSSSIVEKYAEYPIEGELISFPGDKISSESGLGFIPEVTGADGYTTSNYGITVGDNHLTLTRFEAHGVNRSEYDSYRQAVIGAGFTEKDDFLYYGIDNNRRVVMALNYLAEDEIAYFYFYTEEYDPLSQPTIPTPSGVISFVFKNEGAFDTTICYLEFAEDYIFINIYSTQYYRGSFVYVKNGDVYEKYSAAKENIGNLNQDQYNGSYSENEIIAELNNHFDGKLFFNDFSYLEKRGEEEICGVEAAVYNYDFGGLVYISLEYGIVLKNTAMDFELIATDDNSFNSVFPAPQDVSDAVIYNTEAYILRSWDMNMDSYTYMRNLYTRLYRSIRMIEIERNVGIDYIRNYMNAIDALNTVDSIDDVSLGAAYYVLYDSAFEFDEDFGYSYNRSIIITDGQNVLDLFVSYDKNKSDDESYENGRVRIIEYSLYGGAKDYFGDEFDTDIEIGDYTSLGTVTITVGQSYSSNTPNGEDMPPLHSTVITIDFGGRLVIDQWGGFFYFDGSSPTIGGSIIYEGDDVYLCYGSETTLTSKEYVAGAIGYILARKYDTSSMERTLGEWLGRECYIYKGYYTYRGVQYELEFWQDVQTGLNLYVKRQNETTNGSKIYTVYVIESLELGEGIGMTEEEFLALPVK